MMKMHHHMKTLTCVLSVLIILLLTSSGFGGRGRESLTVFAKVPSKDSDGITGVEREDARSEDRSQEGLKSDLESEFFDYARRGGRVVGYMLEKDMRDRQERMEAVISRQDGAEHQVTEIRERERNIDQKEDGKNEDAAKETAGIVSEDYQVLLKIVEAEAGVCDSRGKILVANVVLNRVRSQEFPDTITEVVYQPSQFSPVSNGSINTCKVTSQTIECVNRALAGEDYSQGALYFMNRGASGSGAVRWFDGRLTFLFSHQSHEFFK